MPFRDITGHQRVIGLLSRSMARGRLPQSLIFGGPQGVGKAKTALALAQTVNCQAPVLASAHGRGERDGEDRVATELDIDSCGRCPSCQRIARGVHPDVLRIEPGDTGSIKIDQVREAVETLMYRPFEGRRRVVIVDEADALGIPPQSALLKTLEEPGPSSIFVLVTARPDSLLPTVRSRCAVLRFAGLSAAEVASVLVARHGYADGDARAVAAIAGGSIGRALEARAVDFAAARNAAHDVLHGVAGTRDARERLEMAQDLLPKKPSTPIEREHLSVRLRAMSSLLRDVGILAAGADPAAMANVDLRADLERLVDGFGDDRAARAFTAVDQALIAIDHNVSPKTVADWVVLQL